MLYVLNGKDSIFFKNTSLWWRYSYKWKCYKSRTTQTLPTVLLPIWCDENLKQGRCYNETTKYIVIVMQLQIIGFIGEENMDV